MILVIRKFRGSVVWLMLVAMLLSGLCSFAPTPPKAFAADAYDTLRSNWVTLMTGGSSVNTTDPDIASYLTTINNTAQTDWNNLNKTTGRTYLFPDATTQYPNAHVTLTYKHLREMALAYATVGTSLYQNANLLTDIISGLDWIYANWYNDTTAYGTQSSSNNWFEWEIGAPQNLEDTMALVYAGLTATQLSHYTKAIEHYDVNPNYIGTSMGSTWSETGANRAWKSKVWADCGILKKDSTELAAARDAMTPLFTYSTSGDGFYTDGSFIQHSAYAYTSGYGLGLLGASIDTMYLLNGSSWAISSTYDHIVRDWINNSFKPLIFRDRIYDNLYGRAITRYASSDSASTVITASYKMAQLLTGSDKTALESFAKYLISSDTSFAYKYYDPWTITNLKNMMNDNSIPTTGDPSLYKQFPMMDRFSFLRPGFGFSAAMYSSRIYNYESINGENLMGWHTDDGRTTLYNSDLTQYGDYYWATVDKYRLPGTTVEALKSSDIYSPQISQVSVTGGSSINDPLNDWTKVSSHTSGWVFDNASPLDGDTSRLKRQSDTMQSIVYHDASTTNFSATFYYISGQSFSNLATIYSSPDGNGFTSVPLTLSTPVLVSGTNWYKVVATPSGALPSGTNYIKIELDTTDSQPASTSDKSWVGGTDLDGLYGASGMILHPQGETLNAKKSWFMFDNEIVNLGAGITSSDNTTVESIVENRKLNTNGDNTLTVNGMAKPSTLGWSETMTGVNWMHLAGNIAGSDIGYYFPGGATINGLREARTGSFADESQASGVNTTSYTRNYMTLWVNHGTDPGKGTTPSGSYSYVLLPNMSASQVSSYASNPTVSVLENSTAAQGVKETALNIEAVNFWADQVKKVDMIQSDHKASIMTKITPGDNLEVSVSDPTMLNTGTINVELSQAATSGFVADPGITVTQTSPTIKFTVNVNNAKGKAFKAKFNLSATPWPSPATTVTDNLNDWSIASAHSANLVFDTTNPATFNGDTSRVKRTTNTAEYVEYNFPYTLNFSAKVYYYSALVSGEVTAYASSDNTNWTTVTLTNDTPVATSGGWYGTTFSPSSGGLPANTHYLKIQLANDTRIYSPQLASVQLETGKFTDDLNDWSHVLFHSSNWAFDSTNTSYFEGDASRLKRTSNTPESLVYHYPNTYNFSAKVYYLSSIAGKVNAYTSPDGVNWTPVTLSNDTPVATGGGWYRTNFTPLSVPAGTHYIKLELANDSTVYTPQLSQVSLWRSQ